MFRKLSSILICFSILACSCKPKHEPVTTYRNVNIPIPFKAYKSYLDSLYRLNIIEVKSLQNNGIVLGYPENYNGIPYYALLDYVSDNSVVVGLKVQFIGKAEFNELPLREIYDPKISTLEQITYYSGDLKDEVITEDFEKYILDNLKIKYGEPLLKDTTLSTYTAPNGYYNKFANQNTHWKTDALDIMFTKKTQLNFGAVKLFITYTLTEEYLQKNKQFIEQLKKSESPF